jgi:hypothetical protein
MASASPSSNADLADLRAFNNRRWATTKTEFDFSLPALEQAHGLGKHGQVSATGTPTPTYSSRPVAATDKSTGQRSSIQMSDFTFNPPAQNDGTDILRRYPSLGLIGYRGIRLSVRRCHIAS